MIRMTPAKVKKVQKFSESDPARVRATIETLPDGFQKEGVAGDIAVMVDRIVMLEDRIDELQCDLRNDRWFARLFSRLQSWY